MAEILVPGSPAHKAATALVDTTLVTDMHRAKFPTDGEHGVAYRKWIRALKGTKRLDHKKVWKAIAEPHRPKTLKQYYKDIEIASKAEAIDAFVRAIDVVGVLEPDRGHEDELYFAMLKFLGIPRDTSKKTEPALRGTFQVWRHSTTYPGRYMKGLIEFGRSQYSEAVRARMLQRYVPMPEDDKDHQLSPKDDQIDEGYIFRLTGEKEYILMLADTDLSPAKIGSGRGMMRVSVLKPDSTARKVKSLEGNVFGIDRSRTIFSDVYMDRVSDDYPGIDKHIERLKAQGKLDRSGPNLYKKAQVPDLVLRLLENRPVVRKRR